MPSLGGSCFTPVAVGYQSASPGPLDDRLAVRDGQGHRGVVVRASGVRGLARGMEPGDAVILLRPCAERFQERRADAKLAVRSEIPVHQKCSEARIPVPGDGAELPKRISVS